MTDNDRHHHDFNPINIGNPAKSADQYLTRKTVYDRLSNVKDKPTTRKRIFQVLIALAFLALVIVQGLLESNPNH